MNDVVQAVLYLAILVVLAVPLGGFIKKVMDGEKNLLSPVVGPVERGIYRVLRIDAQEEMSGGKYTLCVVLFAAICLAFLWVLQMVQAHLPANPQSLPNVSWDLAFNTAASFVTNTNWQAYSGESTLSYLTQFLGLTVQNFVSAATGIAVLFALTRGLFRAGRRGLGSYWVDMVRIVFYLLIPLNLVISLCLVGGGVIQNFAPAQYTQLVEPIVVVAGDADGDGAATFDADGDGDIDADDAANVQRDDLCFADGVLCYADGTRVSDQDLIDNARLVSEQFIPGGPAASQVSTKQSGTNGGGFMGTNSAHPLENPSPWTNLVEMISLLLIPAALCFTFGRGVGNKRQGVALFLAMFIMLVVFLAIVVGSEQAATPQLAANGVVNVAATEGQAGGNMEGKETRFGIVTSATWAAFTTAASNGSVNSMHDSYTPLGGLVMLLQMELGEVVFGGVGCGLYGMLAFAILAVFIAGLMVGRTPEFLGKKIEPFEMKWATLACLATPIAILVGCGVASLVPSVADSVSAANAGGPHAFSELLYAYSSGGGNNGSAFAGFSADTVFLNVTIGLVMIFARLLPIVAILKIADSMGRKKRLAQTAGTLSTTNGMFVFLLILVVLLIGALSFFPALALGPLAEFFTYVA